ncbi:hypothetical protein EVAR_52324_1 [Eumeta japonica]|uniref:MADF domain-containing protein n=1 Tax=Eumeta variegata TaxID=151549 RepID=A0A4C1Y787_EUMVA|nr:hypothetical protein EVAR_52324_1 [Eumeta japonica]
MPRRTCYWTRKLELDLVELVKKREFIWKPIGNTNHHIQQKYKGFAEIATILGNGFTELEELLDEDSSQIQKEFAITLEVTQQAVLHHLKLLRMIHKQARLVRDRWVNIRSTFNHNVRRVIKSKLTAKSSNEIYVPCWPLWKPLQFLKDVYSKNETNQNVDVNKTGIELVNDPTVKEEVQSDIEENLLEIRQRGQRTDRPRHRGRVHLELKRHRDSDKCKRVLNDLIRTIAPLTETPLQDSQQTYWFFGKHVVERLNNMRPLDARCATHEIFELLNKLPNTVLET